MISVNLLQAFLPNSNNLTLVNTFWNHVYRLIRVFGRSRHLFFFERFVLAF
jgi:hypothetical protein